MVSHASVPTLVALLASAVATVGFAVYGVRLARTTSDFLVASRSVGPRFNAAAISGEYLSAASFLGVAGLIAKYGADALWYPVGFTAGYLGLLMFVAAPLRRSGAYTVPDFTEFRLGSLRLRRLASLVVVLVCAVYLIPQFQGAGLTLRILLGVPGWVGAVAVGSIVIGTVVGGGMRSITFVQAFQYWLKLTAVALPALVLTAHFFGDRPATADLGPWLRPGGGLGGPHPLYAVYSLIIATFLGTMGLPHVLVRFYTNPDGRAARTTAATVIGLVGAFYLFPTLLGAFARIYAPQTLGADASDAAALLLPESVLGGLPGQLLGALVAAGALAAFLSASSGLLVSIAGVVSTDLLRGRIRDFRVAALIAGAVPLALSLMVVSLDLSRTVGLAFSVAASTLCPLLTLGIWWRGLTATGAAAGLIAGGLMSGAATAVSVAGGVPDRAAGGWPAAVLSYPAAVSVPLAFATMVAVSGFTRGQSAREVARAFARLHAPERLGMGADRERGLRSA
ncbi:sodium/solute symporter [Nocardia aurantiaca]|uniref:Cation acetate symporter n=1 Tax=Nocardia aurantiaca TaxID=2675850 RepID=A0A6I3KZV1_9NOCA|nr:cation acetate symporter [Nocardia aurantiaca]MTE13965.1 cation acetate symporter [Nocardia aurantiaca]